MVSLKDRIKEQARITVRTPAGNRRKAWVTVTCIDGRKRQFNTPAFFKTHGHAPPHNYHCAICGKKVNKPLKNHICEGY